MPGCLPTGGGQHKPCLASPPGGGPTKMEEGPCLLIHMGAFSYFPLLLPSLEEEGQPVSTTTSHSCPGRRACSDIKRGRGQRLKGREKKGGEGRRRRKLCARRAAKASLGRQDKAGRKEEEGGWRRLTWAKFIAVMQTWQAGRQA